MFLTLKDKIITPDLSVHIENLEISEHHWKSSKSILTIADRINFMLCSGGSFEDLESELIQIFLDINKQNTRIDQINFYTDPTFVHTLVCVCVSDIKTFKPDNWLSRNIVINLKKRNKVLLITDVTTEEWNSPDKELFPQWRLCEKLSNKYNKHKKLFL